MTYKPKPEDCQGTAVPHCPHCGHEIKDWWDGLDALKRDGDADETECGSCAKPFRIVIHVSHTFTTTIVPLPAEEAVADWNRKHPPGVPVTVRKDDLKYVDTHTRSPAELNVNGVAVIWLEGIAGYYLLARVTRRWPHQDMARD